MINIIFYITLSYSKKLYHYYLIYLIYQWKITLLRRMIWDTNSKIAPTCAKQLSRHLVDGSRILAPARSCLLGLLSDLEAVHCPLTQSPDGGLLFRGENCWRVVLVTFHVVANLGITKINMNSVRESDNWYWEPINITITRDFKQSKTSVTAVALTSYISISE